MHPNGNTTTIIFNTDAAISMHRDRNMFTKAAQSFIRSVIQNLLNDVQGIIGSGVHSRPLTDWFKAFEDLNRRFTVFGSFTSSHARKL